MSELFGVILVRILPHSDWIRRVTEKSMMDLWTEDQTISKSFYQKRSFMNRTIHTLYDHFSLGACQGMHVRSYASNNQAWVPGENRFSIGHYPIVNETNWVQLIPKSDWFKFNFLVNVTKSLTTRLKNVPEQIKNKWTEFAQFTGSV